MNKYSKTKTSKKKQNKKQKNIKNIFKTTQGPSSQIIPSKLLKNQTKIKNKVTTTTPKYYNIPVSINTNTNRNKKPKIITDPSSFFYYNYSKVKSSEESVKEYLKFVKNITITYPVMIPSREDIKSRESFRKNQKQKEKSRDLNSNRNSKSFTQKPTTTTLLRIITTTPKERTTGNFENISKKKKK